MKQKYLKVPREDMVLCPVRDSLYYDDNKNPINEYFECPGPEDPPDHNRFVVSVRIHHMHMLSN